MDFAFVPSSGAEYARFELYVSLGKTNSIMASWKAPNGRLGDFGSVAIESSNLGLQANVSFSTGFAVILGPDDEEALTMLGTACFTENTSMFSCPLNATQFQLNYTEEGATEKTIIMTLEAAAENTSASERLKAAFDLAGAGIANVTEIGRNLLNIEFNSRISFVQLTTLKSCMNVNDKTVTAVPSFSCDEGFLPVKISNSYGLEDQVTSKRSFQVSIAQSNVTAEVALSGVAVITANLNDVIAVGSTIHGDISGDVSLTVGEGGYTSYTTWVQDVISLTNVATSGTFDGSFTAAVRALAPFDSSANATGNFTKPYEVNFTHTSAPDIKFDVALPGIGDVRFLTYHNVVSCLSITQQFLVGDGTVETCSGGILDFELFGKNVFYEKIPSKIFSRFALYQLLLLLVNTPFGALFSCSFGKTPMCISEIPRGVHNSH
jgi:hypothetical protein